VGFVYGWVRSWRQGLPDRKSWVGLFWLALWFGIIFIGWLRWDVLTPAPGGRLLFPAIVSTSVLLAFGGLQLSPVMWRGRISTLGVLLLFVAAVITLFWQLYPLFAPPPTYTPADAPTPSHSLEGRFWSPPSAGEPVIGIRGYEAATGDSEPVLDLALYWETLDPTPTDYVLAVQLTSPVPGDDTLRFNYNTWPGRGNYPTSAWAPDQVVVDRYRFRLPRSDTSTQAWQLLVAFYDRASGQRLPAYVGSQEVGTGLTLTTLRVPGRVPDCPPEVVLTQPVRFGQYGPGGLDATFALTGAMVRAVDDASRPGLQVTLCWESLGLASDDYTVFVHLYDESGELINTGDGPPMKGAFPTSLWQPGDRIVDEHFVPFVTGSPTRADYPVGVGLYDLDNGVRLQAVQNDEAAPNNTVLLGIEP
jgi:hypothetical protein